MGDNMDCGYKKIISLLTAARKALFFCLGFFLLCQTAVAGQKTAFNDNSDNRNILKDTGLHTSLSEDREVVLAKKKPEPVVRLQETVTGTVTDAQSGETLPGVNILVKGTATGISTDSEGNFELTVESLQDTLVVSYIGYQKQEVPINGRTTIDIAMETQAIMAEELVVTALGFTESAREVTSSSSGISSKSLEQSGAPDLLSSMSGQASGVNIRKSSGRPGSSSRIVIRGQVSLQGDNQPLFVVDGVPVASGTIGSGDTGVYQQSRINDLNPSDIESMRVLKGPSAAAIWGSRASNGVVVITTKQGSRDQFNVNLTSTITLTDVNRTVDMQQKFGQGIDGEYVWGSRYTWGDRIADRPGGEDVRARPNFPYSEIIQKNSKKTYDHSTDYMETGYTFDNALGISGGDDNSTFYLSFSNKNQDGYIKEGSNFRSTSVRGNFSRDFGSNFDASLKVNYVGNNANRLTKGNELQGVNIAAYRTPPDFNQRPYSITYIDENGNSIPNRHRAYRNPDGSNDNPGYDNPFWLMNNISNTSEVDRLIGSTQLNYSPTSWLNITERLGIDYYTDTRDIFKSKLGSSYPEGQYEIENYKRYQINSDLVVQASQQFNENNYGSIMIGWNLNERRADNHLSTTSDLILENAPPNLGNGENLAISNYKSIQRTSALYAVLKFTALNQIHLKMTGRSESASTYGPGTDNTYFYPSASAAWEFTQLDLFKNPDFLSFGKLRASYGTTGVQPGVYATQTLYEIASFHHHRSDIESIYYGGGADLDNVRGNDQLEPELSKKLEFGVDLRFLNDRVSFTANQYFNFTEQAILNIDLPSSTGFTSRVANGAKIENVGTELDLSIDWLQSQNLNWQTGVNWATNQNEVTDLSGAEFVSLGFSGIVARKNEPFGVIQGTTFARDENDEHILNANGFPTLAPGVEVIGDPNPDWTMGISNTISYKSFTLGALLEIRQGGDLINRTKGVQKFFGVQGEQTWETTADQDLVNYNGETIPEGTTFRGYVEDFGGGPVAIDQAWFVDGLGGGFSGADEQFVEDAGFVRIRNISLSYNLASPSFKNTTGLSSAEFTVKANNPFLWTDYSGVDPETSVSGPGNGQGVDYFNPPGIRTLIFSVSVNY